MTHRYAVGLGGNLGDRLGTLREAARRLAAAGTVVRVSRVYETEPVGPPQPRFLNAVALLQSDLEPPALMRVLLDVERDLGRVREEEAERWGPRVIDLDLLVWEGAPYVHPDITIPHPRLRERAFALIPLRDVWPEALDPSTGEPWGPAPNPGVEPTGDALLLPQGEGAGTPPLPAR